MSVQAGQLCRPRMSTKVKPGDLIMFNCYMNMFRISVSKLLTHLEKDHETEDFVRVEGGEYSSHFIVNEEDFSKSIMWISDQLHYNGGYFYRECCRR